MAGRMGGEGRWRRGGDACWPGVELSKGHRHWSHQAVEIAAAVLP